MISFQDLMKGFGVVTVMNACIYKLSEGSYVNTNKCEHNNSQRALTPFDFECTHLYLDTLKIANLTMEGPTKTITGGQYSNPLLKYGKTMTLEMQSALGSAELLKTFFGCDYDETNGVLSVTDKFPGAFAIEGETFFIDQKTGEKKKVWIFIPNFTPDGVFNLTQDAEGDAAVFDCNGTIGMARIKDTAHPDGHDIFYHIADKSWLRIGYIITPELNFVWDDASYGYICTGFKNKQTLVYDGDLVIPGIHTESGKSGPVTVVGAHAFHKATENGSQGNWYGSPNITLRRVYVPSTVHNISSYAFEDQTELTKIVFGGNSDLRRIENRAFVNTPKLQPFTIPPKTNWVTSDAFGSYILDADTYEVITDNEFDLPSGALKYDAYETDDGSVVGRKLINYADNWALSMFDAGDHIATYEVLFPENIQKLSEYTWSKEFVPSTQSIILSQAFSLGEDEWQVGDRKEIACIFQFKDGAQCKGLITYHRLSSLFMGFYNYTVEEETYSFEIPTDIYVTIPDDITCLTQQICADGQTLNFDSQIKLHIIIHNPNCFIAMRFFGDKITDEDVEIPYLTGNVSLPWDEKEARLCGYPWSADDRWTFTFKE